MCRTESTTSVKHIGRFQAFWRKASSSDDVSPSEAIASKGATEKLKGGFPFVSVLAGNSVSSSSYSLSSVEEQPDQQLQQFEGTPLDQSGIDEFVAALSATYTALIAVKQKSASVTSFHAVRAPPITIEEYLARIRKYFDCSDACLFTSLMYIDRVVKLHPTFAVCNRTIHRLLAVSMVLAAKFNDDVYYSNNYYAKVCGLTLKEMNALEVEFLNLMNWKLDVSSAEYHEYLDCVLSSYRKLGRR